MRLFVIADTHFGHKDLAEKYQSRPEDFEDKIIQNWRRMVADDDMVIHLGDVVVGKSKDWSLIVPKLPGRKILVLGNHDKNPFRWYMANGFDFCCNIFFWELFGLQIAFSHTPLFAGDFELNIHGHLHMDRHREYERDERHYLFGLENNAYQPRTLDSIVKVWKRSNNMD